MLIFDEAEDGIYNKKPSGIEFPEGFSRLKEKPPAGACSRDDQCETGHLRYGRNRTPPGTGDKIIVALLHSQNKRKNY